jgi:hypothetical protein
MTRVIFEERLNDIAVEELSQELVRHVEDFLNQEHNIVCLSTDSDRLLNEEFKKVLSKFFGLE